jgi:hypothetical protein
VRLHHDLALWVGLLVLLLLLLLLLLHWRHQPGHWVVADVRACMMQHAAEVLQASPANTQGGYEHDAA